MQFRVFYLYKVRIHHWLNHDLKMPIEKAQEQWNQPQPIEYVPATRVALRFGRAVFVIVHQYRLSILIIVFMLLTALKIYNLMIWGNS